MRSFFRPRVRTETVKGRHTGLPSKPFISEKEAIVEGLFDYVEEKEDAAPAQQEKPTQLTQAETNKRVKGLKPTPEIPRGQGFTSSEPFGDQAGTKDWGGGDGEEDPQEPAPVWLDEYGRTSQEAANVLQRSSTAKLEALRAIPEFYQVQDKTGRVKFRSGSIEALVETYSQITSNDESNALSKLTPSQRDILEMAWKLKYGDYKSIDQLSEDIALCANISEEPANFKANFESIANALGVTSDSQKRLFDLSNYNNKRLNNVTKPLPPGNLPVQETTNTPAAAGLEEVDPDREDRHTPTSNNQETRGSTPIDTVPNSAPTAALGEIEKVLSGDAKPENQSQELSSELTSEEISALQYLFTSLQGNKGEVEISKKEWELLQRVNYTFGRAAGKNLELQGIAAEYDGKDGLEEKVRLYIAKKATEKAADEAEGKNVDNKIPIPRDYIDYVRNLFEKLIKDDKEGVEIPSTKGQVTAKLGNQLGDMEFPNKTTSSNEPLSTHPDEKRLSAEDIEMLKAKIEEFKKIQREGVLSNEQLSEFIALAKLQEEKGFGQITYSEVPATLLSETSYDDKAEQKPVNELPKEIQKAANEAITRARIEAEKAAREVRRVATGVAAVNAKTQSNLKEALERLGDPAEMTFPEKVGKLTEEQGEGEEMPSVPDFLKQKEARKRGWREKIFGVGSKVGSFIDRFRSLRRTRRIANGLPPAIAGNYKRAREFEEGRDDKKSLGAGALILLSLLGVTYLGSEGKQTGPTKEPTTLTDPAKPLASGGEGIVYDLDKPNYAGGNYVGARSASETRMGENTKNDELGQYTKITPELRKECQAGNYKHMIGCIKAVVGTQTPEVRKGLVKIIAEAAEERAKSEGVTWSKLNKKEKDAYIDAVLGGTQDKTTNSITKKDSPASAVAKHYRLNVKDITFTGADGLSKIGIDVAKFKTPESLDQKVIVDMIVSQLKK